MILERKLKGLIREIPNFPKPGVLFRDITPVLQSVESYQEVIAAMAKTPLAKEADVIAAFDARGFLFGAPLAIYMRKPLALIRKKGKLPAQRIEQKYDLEYGTASVEMHEDVIVKPGNLVFLVDDLLATGGTAEAGCKLVERLGGIVSGLGFVIELTELNGKKLLSPYKFFSLVKY